MTTNFETTENFIKRNELDNEGAVVTVTDKSTGGSIGTAATTVDVAGIIHINQTTAGQTLTLPTPTITTVDKRVNVMNIGSATFTILNKTIAAGASVDFDYSALAASPSWVATGSTSTTLSTGNIASTGSILSSSATAGVGYSTGAGGTVTQGTSRTTGVTLNKVNGEITMFSAAGSATAASFTVTNSAMAATDNVVLNVKSATNKYVTIVSAKATGSFEITFFTTGGTTSDAPVVSFEIFKGVAA